MLSRISDTLLWKKGFKALVVVSTAEIEHSESESIITHLGFILASLCIALTVVLAILDSNTVPDNSLLGTVYPFSGVTLALAQSRLAS